jgi:lipoyl(octanoyl) transferase
MGYFVSTVVESKEDGATSVDTRSESRRRCGTEQRFAEPADCCDIPAAMPASPTNIAAPTATSAGVAIVDWGRTRYAESCQRQTQMVDQRIASEIGDTLVFTEHEPVFTVGMRGGADAHLVWSAERLVREGVELAKTNRGGDITYHGPGQIVGYPIVSLVSRKDLHAYLRFLEQVLIDSLRTLGLMAARREGLTGIWIERRKIAAIGVAVRRWVTYHGFALNVNVDLAPFGGIIPCGISAVDGTVTSMQAELGKTLDLRAVKSALAAEFGRQWPAFLKPLAS